jgi:hypothetical protein
MSGEHDEVTIDPEYARSYQHYLSSMRPQDDAARAAAAHLAYAWTKQQQSKPAAPPRKTNHVAHGLLMAFTVLVGGPIAFCVGLGGSMGNEEEGIPARPGAFWIVLAGWLLVVGVQGFIWARAAQDR